MPFLKHLLLFSLMLAFASCGKNSEKEAELPPGILNEAQFTKVICDFALAESAANMNVKNVVIQKTDSVYAFDPLYENNVRKSQYDSTVRYYAARPELYKKVYEKVMETLSELQAKRNGLKVDSTAK